MRWIIRTILAILVLGLLAMGALLSIPAERIADVAADRLQRATERPVRITGGIRPTLVPYLGVRVEGLEIGNPDWVSDGPMLQAEALNIGVNWQALIAGRIQLDQASLDAPRLVLVRAADGRESWSFGGADASPAPASNGSEAAPAAQSSGGVLATLGFDAAVLRDATVLYRDLGAGTTTVVEALDLTMSLPEAGGAARAEASAIVNGSALTVDASIDGIGDLLAGEVQPVTLALEWDGGTLSFDGRAGLDPAADGRFQLEARDLGPLMAAFGQVAPTLPEGLGRDRIDVAGGVTLASEGSVHLRAGDIRLDDHRFTADLDLLPGAERPMLRGVIRGGDVDLSAMTAGGNAPDAGRSGAAGGADPGWPRDRIDVSGLFAADMDLAVTLDALDLGLASLDGLDLRARLDRGRLVLDLRRIGAYGGALSGSVVVNGRGGLSTRADLAFRGVALGPLLAQLADYDRLEGRGDIALNVLAVGNDMDALMRSLDGGGSVTLGQGAILGFDLAGMIRNFDPSYRGEGQRTVYDSLTGSFTIAGGVLRNEDLVLAAPWGRVTGAGRTDIGAQTVEYRVIPGVLQGADGTGGFAVPILITGPWSDLSFRPDLAFIAEQELAEERARLEAAARERLAAEREELERRLRDQAGDALGVEIEEGQSREEIEDALEQRLREQAEEQLRRLLE